MSPWKSLATIRKSLWSREQRIFSIRGFGLSLKWKRLEKVSDIRRKVYLIYLARERLMTTNIILYCLRQKNFILCVLVFHLIKRPNVEFEQSSEFYNEVNAIFRNLLDHLLSHLQSISSFSMFMPISDLPQEVQFWQNLIFSHMEFHYYIMAVKLF